MKTVVFLITFTSFLFFVTPVFAVSVTIIQYPSVVTLDPFTLSASISGATNGTNYLRIDIYKDGTQSYFGTTFNGTDWYGDTNYQSYLPITIVSNKWSGSIMGNIGSPNASQYDGTGIYRIRLRRYTSGGTYTASEAEASSVVVSIVTPTPTPTPTDVPTSTPFPTPTPAPTNTPVPSPTPIKSGQTPTSKPTFSTTKPSSIPSILLDDTSSSASSATGDILGSSTTAVSTLLAGDKTQDRQIDWFPIITTGSGILILIYCGILFYQNYKKQHEYTNNQKL